MKLSFDKRFCASKKGGSDVRIESLEENDKEIVLSTEKIVPSSTQIMVPSFSQRFVRDITGQCEFDEYIRWLKILCFTIICKYKSILTFVNYQLKLTLVSILCFQLYSSIAVVEKIEEIFER